MKIKVVDFAEIKSNKTWRLEAEYYTQPSLITSNYVLGVDAIKSFEYGTSEALNENGEGFPTLRLNEFDTIFIKTPEKYCNRIDYNTFKCLSLRKNDVLVCRTNGNPRLVGKTAIVPDDYDYAFASYLFRARPNTGIVNSATLAVYLNSKVGRAEVEKNLMISNQSNFSPERFRDIRIPKIGIYIQELVEKTVYAAFGHHEAAKSSYYDAEQILLSELGLEDWKPKHELSFVKNLSDSKNADRIDAEYFQPKYDEIKRMINRGKCIPLGKCFDLISSSYFDYLDDGDVGVIKTKQLTGRFISFEVESKTSRKILEDNRLPEVKDRDVLFASMGVGSLGKANIYYEFENDAKTKFTVDSTIRIMRQNPNSEIGPELLALYLSSIVGQELIYQNIVGTSGIISIYRTYLEHLPIPLLDQKTQDTLSAHILHAHKSRRRAKKLLDIAKRGVEIAIEQGETEAHNWIDQETKGIPSS